MWDTANIRRKPSSGGSSMTDMITARISIVVPLAIKGFGVIVGGGESRSLQWHTTTFMMNLIIK